MTLEVLVCLRSCLVLVCLLEHTLRYVFVKSGDSMAGVLCCCKLRSWKPERASLAQRGFMSRSVGPLGFYTD